MYTSTILRTWLCAIAVAATLWALPPVAVAGSLKAGAQVTLKALMPLAEVTRITEGGGLDCTPGTPSATCDLVLQLIRRLLSSSYLLTSSAAAPEPGNAGRYAALIYSALRRGPLRASP